MEIKIIKIGGAVFSTKSGIEGVINLLKGLNQDNAVVIISALGKSTALLRKMALSAVKNDVQEIRDGFITLKHSYTEFELGLFGVEQGIIKPYLKDLEQILNSVKITREITLRVLDRILAYGERMTAEILYKWLVLNCYNAEFTPAEELIVTNNEFGKAIPILDETLSKMSEKINFNDSSAKIILSQGFIAKSKNGDTTTMGFESSNLTAILFADFLKAKSLEIWTLPSGIRSGDPMVFKKNQLIDELNYQQALELSSAGLKLLHRQMLEFADANNIEIIYKSAVSINNEYTLISKKSRNRKVIAVTNENNQELIQIFNIEKDAINNIISQIDKVEIESIKIEKSLNNFKLDVVSSIPFSDNIRLNSLISNFL